MRLVKFTVKAQLHIIISDNSQLMMLHVYGRVWCRCRFCWYIDILSYGMKDKHSDITDSCSNGLAIIVTNCYQLLPMLASARAIIKVSGHQHQWFPGVFQVVTM